MNYSESVLQGIFDPATPSWCDRLSRLTRRLFLDVKGRLVKHSPYFFWNAYGIITGGPLEKEIRFLSRLCNKNKTSIDVGANYGGYLCPMIKHSQNCIAFEPIVEIAAILREGFESTAVEIFPAALSDHCGTARLKYPVYHPGYSTIEPANRLVGKIRHDKAIAIPEVHVRTLDSYLFKNIGFIKIDVEGHEIEVLRGAVNTLKDSKPNLLVEIEERHRHGAIALVTAFLAGLGYQGYFQHNGKLVSLNKFDVAREQNPKRPRDYVRNFIFSCEAI